MSGWADFDNASWGSRSAAFPSNGVGGGGATAASQTPPRPSSRTQMPMMEGIGSAHNVVGSSTPPRHSHHHSSSRGKSSLGSKLASFKRSYGQPQYDDDGLWHDDDGMGSVVSGTSAVSSMSVGTRLQRKIGKMRGLGGSNGGNANGGNGSRTPGRNAAGSSSRSNYGGGGFSGGGGGGDFADFASANANSNAFDADFGAAFGDPPLQQQLQDAHSVGGGSSFGDANSLASSGTGGTGNGGDPFAIVSTPERKRFGFTSASESAHSPGSAATRRQHHGGGSSGDGAGGGHGGGSYGDGTISSSPRMSKFSFLRNSSRRNQTANRMATAPGMPTTTTTTTTPGGSVNVNVNAVSASPTPSHAGGNGANTNTSDMSRRARAKSRESMKRTWDHSRKLAAMAATPGADGKRPDLGAAPYSPASAYAMTPGGGIGGGGGSRTPQTPQTPQVQLQDTWTPNWGEASSSSSAAGGAAAAAAAASASKQDIISQGVAALASGAVNGFDPYGLAAGTTPKAATKSEAPSLAAPAASGGRDSNSTPKHSNLQQQQQQQGNRGDDPFAFDAAFGDNDASTAGGDGFSSSSGWGHHPQQHQQQASTPTRQHTIGRRGAAVDDGNRSTKSPHTHRMAAAPSPSRQQQQYQQQERYPDRPTKGGLDRFIEQQQRQDHVGAASGGASSRGSLLAKSQGSVRNSSVAGSRGGDDDTASIISGTSAYSNATGTSSANAAAARRKMRKSMQQARSATGRSQTVLSGGDVGTATTAQSTATPRDRTGSGSGGPSASGRPPISPAPAKTAFADDHSAGGYSAGSDDFNSFDAFGLNAKDIDKEVGAALNDLVGSNPDLGFFLDRNRSMSQSSAGGASGSVRSSVGGASVGSSIEADQQQSRGDQFKEASMANGHVHRNVRPPASNGNSPIPPRHTGGSVQARLNGLQSPDLDHITPATNNNSKYAGRNPADRLRKDIQRRKQQHPSAVSDVGASTSRSEPEFNAVLNKMKQNRGLGNEKDVFDSSSHADEESRQGSHQEPQHLANLKPVPKDSSRDAMSDVGGASSSHLFLDSVKLRKTGARLDTNDEATAGSARETPSTFNTEATDGSQGFFEGDGRFDGEDHPSQRSEPVISPSAGSAPQKKMTYRERREIELQEQAELERQRAAMEEAQKEPKVDVAELVRRRVAANRQMDAFPRDGTAEDQPVSPDDALKDMRSRLKSSRSGGVAAPPSAAAAAESLPSDNALADVRSRLKKVSVNDSSPNPAATTTIPQFSPSIRAAADASPSIKAEVEAEAEARNEARPQLSVAALMSQRAKVMAEPESDSEPEAEPGPPQISVAALMAQRSKMAGGPPERLDRASAMPSDDPSPIISDEGKNKLSALFASRSALVPGKKPPPADDNGAKEVLKKTNKSKSVAAAASVASLIGKRAAKSKKDESGAESTDAGPSAPSSDGRPALKDDPKYVKYFKMLKMGLPMPAVKHAMTRDGLDPEVMDGDHSKPAGGSGVPLKEDPKYAKYFKMVCALLVDVRYPSSVAHGI